MHPSIRPSIHAFFHQLLFAPEFFPRVTHVGVSPVPKGNKHVQHSDETPHSYIFGQ